MSGRLHCEAPKHNKQSCWQTWWLSLSKTAFSVLLFSVRHEAFGLNSHHIETKALKIQIFSQNVILIIKVTERRGKKTRTKHTHSTESRACCGMQPPMGMLYWPPALTLLDSGSPWSLLLLAWPGALHNHGSCSNPSWHQRSNQQQLALASVFCQPGKSKHRGGN